MKIIQKYWILKIEIGDISWSNGPGMQWWFKHLKIIGITALTEKNTWSWMQRHSIKYSFNDLETLSKLWIKGHFLNQVMISAKQNYRFIKT